MNRELPRLLLGIAARGYRGPITEQALSSLVAHAKEHGVEAVLSWVEDDPGLLVLPSWQFWSAPLAGLIRDRRQCAAATDERSRGLYGHDTGSNTTK
jgi:hypothetical protein